MTWLGLGLTLSTPGLVFLRITVNNFRENFLLYFFVVLLNVKNDVFVVLVLTFYQFQTSFQTPITFHLKDKRQFNDLEVDKIIWRSKRIFVRLRTINPNWFKILAPTTP